MTLETLWPTLLSWGPPAAILGAALWAVTTGRFWTKGAFDQMVKVYEERLAELRKERDEWKAIAQETGSALVELTRPENLREHEGTERPRPRRTQSGGGGAK